jgi:protein tyrosine phosphatase (PTP) superfamily phosphohydrolase (DUF442 family)
LLGLLTCLPGTLRAQRAVDAEADSTMESIRTFVQISNRIATSAQISTKHIKAIKEAGYQVLVNLGPANERMNKEEAFAVVSAGLTYVQIPVDFKNPQLRDLEFFFQVMNANRDRKVYIHCFANMRVSSFIYLYRVIHEDVAPEEARKTLHQVWEPNEVWSAFIDQALTAYKKR